MTTTWKSVSESDTIFEGHNRVTGELKGMVLRRFDIRLEFRAPPEVYGCADSSEKFVNDFVKAWDKVS
jgi:catalase-peroxidase